MRYSSWIEFGKNLQNLVDKYDKGQIDLSEWLDCMDHHKNDDFSEAFVKFIDRNKDGKISLEELKLFYQAYEIDTSHIEELFATVDFDMGGYISSDEFKIMFDQFLYSEDVQAPGNWFLGAHLARKLWSSESPGWEV